MITDAQLDPAQSLDRSKADRWAWGLCWLMFASTVLNYMDRQTIALVKPAVMAEFRIPNDETFGWLVAAFLLPYALFQVPAGYLADAGNVRKVYALAVAGWSLAGVAAAFSPTLGLLMACRVALGIGESFNWPCGLRVTSRILPPSDRGLGNGIFNSGAAVGAVVAPLTIPLLAAHFGWRAAFVVVGAAGFVWVAAWLAIRPKHPEAFSPRIDPTTRGLFTGRARLAFGGVSIGAIGVGSAAAYFGPNAIWFGVAVLMLGMLAAARLLPESDLSARPWAASLGAIVRRRRFWVMVIVSVSINVCWHFLVNWMAAFFQTERKLGMVRGAAVSALPFLAADAGNLIGGGASRELVRRGWSTIGARRAVIAFCALLVAGGTTIGRIQNTATIVGVLCVMAIGTAAIMANYFALCQDVAPEHTGLVVGVLGGLGNLFAAGFMPLAGRLKDISGGYAASFFVVGLLPFAGVLALFLAWGPEPLAKSDAP